MAWIAGAIAVAGAVASSSISSSAATSAANTEAQGGANSIAEQQREFDIGQENLQPYQQVGKSALYTLADYLGIPGYAGGTDNTQTAETAWASAHGYDLPQGRDWNTQETANLTAAGYTPPTTFTADANTGSLLTPFTFNPATDPGYNAGLNAGTTAISNASTATGGTSGTGNLSGATLKELLQFGQQYAGTQQQIDFSQNQAQKASTYGMLSGAAGMGQNATTTGVQAGANTAASIGNTETGIANAQAAGTVGSANAIGSGITNAANSYNQQQLLSAILKNQNPGVAGVNSGVNLDPTIQPM